MRTVGMHCLLWFVVVCCGLLWFVVVCCGLLWFLCTFFIGCFRERSHSKNLMLNKSLRLVNHKYRKIIIMYNNNNKISCLGKMRNDQIWLMYFYYYYYYYLFTQNMKNYEEYIYSRLEC